MSLSLAIIGGTGAVDAVTPEETTHLAVDTPYGEPSSPVLEWRSGDTLISFIARHGLDSSIPPHRVNYRANVFALRETRPDALLAINAVGGIEPEIRPGTLVFPDQLIDYTSGRVHTYADGIDSPLLHIDFTEPFSAAWRNDLIARAAALGLAFADHGTYGVTQGPRLETAAEIDKLERDGCHIVGMTAMPEAALARELGLDYAICAVVVNRAAGRADQGKGIHAEIQQYLTRGMDAVRQLIRAL